MQMTVKENCRLTAAVWQLVLEGSTADIRRPGQFVQLKLPGFYLRRPISVCDWDADTLTLVYKVVGAGTEAMTTYAPGMALDVLSGLGNGFDTSACGTHPLLIGGGVGLPPMTGLCRELIAECKQPTVLAGFGTAGEVFLRDRIEAIGAQMILTTMDGSAGIRGVVTDALSTVSYDSVCACGPMPMLKAVCAAIPESIPVQVSLEERMGCGFGACMGCTIQTKSGNRRVCADGPVFRREEVLW